MGARTTSKKSQPAEPPFDAYLASRAERRDEQAWAAEKERLAALRRRQEEADRHADAVDERRRQDAIAASKQRHPSRKPYPRRTP